MICIEGKQNFLPQNMPLWHIGYFKLIIFKETADTGEALITR